MSTSKPASPASEAESQPHGLGEQQQLKRAPEAEIAEGSETGAAASVEQQYGTGATLPLKKRTRRRSSDIKKKPKDMPRRPLSAYNFFFQEERPRVLAERNAASSVRESKTDSVKPDPELFAALAQTIAGRWKRLSKKGRKRFDEMAKNDLQRYRREMDAYNFRKEHGLPSADVGGMSAGFAVQAAQRNLPSHDLRSEDDARIFPLAHVQLYQNIPETTAAFASAADGASLHSIASLPSARAATLPYPLVGYEPVDSVRASSISGETAVRSYQLSQRVQLQPLTADQYAFSSQPLPSDMLERNNSLAVFRQGIQAQLPPLTGALHEAPDNGVLRQRLLNQLIQEERLRQEHENIYLQQQDLQMLHQQRLVEEEQQRRLAQQPYEVNHLQDSSALWSQQVPTSALSPADAEALYLGRLYQSRMREASGTTLAAISHPPQFSPAMLGPDAQSRQPQNVFPGSSTLNGSSVRPNTQSNGTLPHQQNQPF